MAVARQSDLIAEYKNLIGGLSTVFYAQLVEMVNALPSGSKEELRNALIEAYPAAINPFLGASANVGASFYEASRASSVGGSFTAVAAPSDLPDGLVDGLARFAVSPLGQEFGTALVVSTLAGASQRHIADAARGSVRANVDRDSLAYGYARKPSPGCCEFCAMLSTRVYSSTQVALSVTGGPSKRIRGKQSAGDKYHDHCQCTTVPVYGDQSNEWDDIIAVNPEAENYLNLYKTAQEMSADAPTGQKHAAVQANMRSLMGL